MAESQKKLKYISESAYLKAEENAAIRHEYVGGSIFAMTGASDAHNIISVNIVAFIHAQLRGSQCRVYTIDMKVKIESAKSYYYPDIMVSCEPFEPNSVFKTSPVLLIEVLSPSTTQIDHREKLLAYQKIDSLKEYVIVHQDRQRVEVYRRESDGWELTCLNTGADLLLTSLPQGSVTLPLNTIYEGYHPVGRVKEDEAAYDADYATIGF